MGAPGHAAAACISGGNLQPGGATRQTLKPTGWLGPSPREMGAAVTPYAEWLTTTAAQAARDAAQITAAATGLAGVRHDGAATGNHANRARVLRR